MPGRNRTGRNLFSLNLCRLTPHSPPPPHVCPKNPNLFRWHVAQWERWETPVGSATGQVTTAALPRIYLHSVIAGCGVGLGFYDV